MIFNTLRVFLFTPHMVVGRTIFNTLVLQYELLTEENNFVVYHKQHVKTHKMSVSIIDYRKYR